MEEGKKKGREKGKEGGKKRGREKKGRGKENEIIFKIYLANIIKQIYDIEIYVLLY